jgi:hypothetical protein
MENYKPRFAGPRWQIVAQEPDSLAVSELQRAVQRLVPYVLPVRRAAGPEEHRIVLNAAPSQAYSIEHRDKTVTISGHLLYGVHDFISQFLRPIEKLEQLPPISVKEQPLVENRGIWTWGYVVYDYRRFIDNMARLRMNMLTLWNDCPPVNARALIEYAHARGVKIIFGFHWGWGLDHLDLSNVDDRRKIKEHVLKNYRENYRSLGADGIYFQTLTEHTQTEKNGRSIASWVCEMVNDTASALLEQDPNLTIQFGLHAISIRERYVDLKPLDPRVTIVWEDAGVIPWSYNPVTDYSQDPGWAKPEGLGSVETTLEYSKKIASLQKEFAMVPKGWINLRWDTEFEHHGPFMLGERDPEWIRRRLEERRHRWEYVNSLWLKNFPVAVKFYREFLHKKLTVTGLIEDGMFEEAIQPSVAIFAETLWNPRREPDEILRLASLRTRS